MMESFAAQWFTAYYITLGSLLITVGVAMIIQQQRAVAYLREAAAADQPPQAFKNVLKYFLLFTVPGFILSFFPFSWIELLFSVWSLIIVFTLGQMLVHWRSAAKQIRQLGDTLGAKVRFAAFNFISLGVVLFMLCYVLLSS
ncbi:MAG: hypothetical protein ACNA78_09620 [Balneolaceae bacterium]